MKYNDWLNFWLENYIEPNAKMRTTESYRRIIDKRLRQELGECEMGELTAPTIQAFVTGLITKGNVATKKGLASSTVNTIITVIQSSLKTAVLSGYIEKNVAESVRRPKIKSKEIECFTVAEQKKMESAALCDKRMKMAGIVLCLYTGLRIGELLALTWEDVDMKSGLIAVNKACHDKIEKNGTARIVELPKTPSSKRIIPVPKQLLPVLRQLKKTGKCETVISSPEGKPIAIRSYQRSFSLFLKKLGIAHKGFHSLRHTFATRALECGMDVKTLSEILGHKNAAITLNRYVHSLTEHKRNMMNRLGKFFAQ